MPEIVGFLDRFRRYWLVALALLSVWILIYRATAALPLFLVSTIAGLGYVTARWAAKEPRPPGHFVLVAAWWSTLLLAAIVLNASFTGQTLNSILERLLLLCALIVLGLSAWWTFKWEGNAKLRRNRVSLVAIWASLTTALLLNEALLDVFGQRDDLPRWLDGLWLVAARLVVIGAMLVNLGLCILLVGCIVWPNRSEPVRPAVPARIAPTFTKFRG